MESTSLQHLRREWGRLAAASGIFLLASFWVLFRFWSAADAAVWLLVVSVLLAYLYASLWKHLGENRLKGVKGALLFDNLGAANRITVLRGVFAAALVGFLFGPRPEGWLAWVPAVLFLADALMDFLDGYIARITGRTTILGERLDMQWDSVAVLAASLLLVLYGQAPLPYLLIGLARYIYLLGLWVHRQRGLPVYDLPPSRYRRAMSGMQMGFIAVALMPLFTPPATQIAALLFMMPTLIGFVRDFLVVTGRIKPTGGDRQGIGLKGYLSLALRAALTALLVNVISMQFALPTPSIGILLAAGLSIPFLVLGVLGRVVALAVLFMAGFGLQQNALEWRYWLILVSSILLFMTGTGKFSLWKPEEWLIDHRAGEARS